MSEPCKHNRRCVDGMVEVACLPPDIPTLKVACACVLERIKAVEKDAHPPSIMDVVRAMDRPRRMGPRTSTVQTAPTPAAAVGALDGPASFARVLDKIHAAKGTLLDSTEHRELARSWLEQAAADVRELASRFYEPAAQPPPGVAVCDPMSRLHCSRCERLVGECLCGRWCPRCKYEWDGHICTKCYHVQPAQPGAAGECARCGAPAVDGVIPYPSCCGHLAAPFNATPPADDAGCARPGCGASEGHSIHTSPVGHAYVEGRKGK